MSFSRTVNINEMDTLIFEGCGIRFPAIVGGLVALKKMGIWGNFKKIVASSGGAFPALFAAVGMDPDEMVDTIDGMDESAITNRTKRSQIPFFGVPISILTKRGLHRSNILIQFAKKILTDRGFPADLTFRQHAELRKKNPRLKEIYLTATNNSTKQGELTVFSSENPITCDVRIAEAFAAALAYPSLFPPVKILINGKECEFTDGGTRENYGYSIIPRDRWVNCLGIKLDTSEEIFGFHYHHARLLDVFFWHVVTDNHFIYESYPNTIKVFDGLIDSFRSLTLIDRQALYMSGELAITAKLTELANTVEHKAEDSSSIFNVQEVIHRKRQATINARTKHYLELMENDSGLTSHLFPTYTFNLLMIYNEIKAWKTYEKDHHEYFVHYNALLDQLTVKSSWSPIDTLIAGYGLSKIRFDLFLLLRELAEEAALFPEATPNLITDVIIAHLKTNEYYKSLALLELLENSDANVKLLKIDHHRILQLLNQDKSTSVEKKQLINFIERYYERLSMTHPGAYETYLTVKFGELLQAKNYSKAADIAEKIKVAIPEDRLKQIYDAAVKQFDGDAERSSKLPEMFPEKNSKKLAVRL